MHIRIQPEDSDRVGTRPLPPGFTEAAWKKGRVPIPDRLGSSVGPSRRRALHSRDMSTRVEGHKPTTMPVGTALVDTAKAWERSKKSLAQPPKGSQAGQAGYNTEGSKRYNPQQLAARHNGGYNRGVSEQGRIVSMPPQGLTALWSYPQPRGLGTRRSSPDPPRGCKQQYQDTTQGNRHALNAHD